MEPTRVFESLAYHFTDDERRALGDKLAQAANKVFDLQQQKKNAVADFAALINSATKRVADLSNKLTCGYELREVECLVTLNAPRPGMKELVRTDTMEFVRSEAMTEDEQQVHIEFSDSPIRDRAR